MPSIRKYSKRHLLRLMKAEREKAVKKLISASVEQIERPVNIPISNIPSTSSNEAELLHPSLEDVHPNVEHSLSISQFKQDVCKKLDEQKNLIETQNKVIVEMLANNQILLESIVIECGKENRNIPIQCFPIKSQEDSTN